MNIKHATFIIGSILVIAGMLAASSHRKGGLKTTEAKVNSFAECATAGFPVMESYPRQCRAAGGRTFTEEIKRAEKEGLIRVFTPTPNQTVASPFLITGEARGYWFFEASFPIELRDDKGKVISTAIAQADAAWMTTDYVPFHAYLEFTVKDAPVSAALVLKKDNPSGLPEHDDQLEIPVMLD